MGVYELSGAGSIKTGRTLYTSMNAGNMYGAMVPIASVDLSGGAYNFVNIPQTYQDLMVVVSSRDTTTGTTTVLFNYINNDGTSIYSQTWLEGNGSSASSGRNANTAPFGVGVQTASGATTGIFASNVIHILNYANTTTFKTVLWRSAADTNGAGQTRLAVGLYRSTAAVSQFFLAPAAGFVAGSTATIYGIRAVS